MNGEDIVSNLFPNIPTLVGHIIATIIILSLFGFLIYKPLRKFISERTEYIQKNISVSEDIRANSTVDRQQATEELRNAEETKEKIIHTAKISAKKVGNLIVVKAKQEADRLKSDAHELINSEKKQYVENARKEMIDIALVAAEKIVKEKLGRDHCKKIVEDFLAE